MTPAIAHDPASSLYYVVFPAVVGVREITPQMHECRVAARCTTLEAAEAARRLLSGECLRGLDPDMHRRNALEDARREAR